MLAHLMHLIREKKNYFDFAYMQRKWKERNIKIGVCWEKFCIG